jgi:hypothetical protein
MSLFQRAETYIHQRKFRENGTPTDVYSAEMEITYPCDSGATVVSMVKIETGTYQGNWDIPSNATYGEYMVEVTTTAGSVISKFVDSFIILPWNITQHVRKTSGIKECNDIDDDDIALIAWNAYIEARDDIFKTHLHEQIKTDSCHCFDGCNSTFYVDPHIVIDHLACGEVAIEGHYIDCNNNRKALTASVLDAREGKIKLLDESGAALSCTTHAAYVTYKTSSANFKDHMFKKAIIYLASHEIILRFNELDKATLADLDSNRPINIANPDRMFKKYKKVCSKIADPKFGGV